MCLTLENIFFYLLLHFRVNCRKLLHLECLVQARPRCIFVCCVGATQAGGLWWAAALTVGFGGAHVREQQQAAVLDEAAEERQSAQHQLLQPLGEVAAVETEVGRGDQVARRRVQADAAAPDVTFRHLVDGGADGREVVWYLVDKSETFLSAPHINEGQKIPLTLCF